MHKKITIFIIAISFLFSINCNLTSPENKSKEEVIKYYYPDLPPDNEDQITIRQGIWGNIWFWKGNFKPTSYGGTITPVIRELLIYELTSQEDVVVNNEEVPDSFYKEIHTKLIKKVSSNKTGFFQAELPEGEYSIFIKEGSLYYANSFSDSFIFPVEVKTDSLSKVQFDVTYDALY